MRLIYLLKNWIIIVKLGKSCNIQYLKEGERITQMLKKLVWNISIGKVKVGVEILKIFRDNHLFAMISFLSKW